MRPAGELGSSDAALARARAAVAAGEAGDSWVRTVGELLDPIPIVSPTGASAGWFVPMAVGEQLVGFVQLDPELRYRRYAGFQRQTGQTQGCPRVREWTDREVIEARALSAVGGRVLAAPVLSYDRHPDRVAWRVEMQGADGRRRVAYVAGTFVAESTGDESDRT
jgi:hypothetical protein